VLAGKRFTKGYVQYSIEKRYTWGGCGKTQHKQDDCFVYEKKPCYCLEPGNGDNIQHPQSMSYGLAIFCTALQSVLFLEGKKSWEPPTKAVTELQPESTKNSHSLLVMDCKNKCPELKIHILYLGWGTVGLFIF
jgi:hypothetical protein